MSVMGLLWQVMVSSGAKLLKAHRNKLPVLVPMKNYRRQAHTQVRGVTEGRVPPTYLMSTALECQRGDGPIHLTAPEHRDMGGGHSAVQ